MQCRPIDGFVMQAKQDEDVMSFAQRETHPALASSCFASLLCLGYDQYLPVLGMTFSIEYAITPPQHLVSQLHRRKLNRVA